MIELRFHHELYDGRAIDQATKVYAPFAAFELVREAEGYIVRVAAAKDLAEGIDERTIAAELASYALGLTVERQSSEAEQAEKEEARP
jgi:hypothetical protein